MFLRDVPTVDDDSRAQALLERLTECTTPSPLDDSQCDKFVQLVCDVVRASWSLERDRGEGYLAFGSGTFAARTVSAYRHFLPQLFDADCRYGLWAQCGPRRTRSSREPTQEDVALDTLLSMLITSRVIPAAQSCILRRAYPGLAPDPTGRSVAQAALDDATAFIGRFDDIARDELENLTGFIVKRLKDTFRAHRKSTGLTSEETAAAATCARFLNCNTWADMSGSFRIPEGDTTDDSSDSDSEPTTVPTHAGDPKFRRTAGQGLHVPHPCLSKFTRRLEGLLQRTLLHPRAAAAYRGDLFHHIAEQLRDSKTVRDMWRDVECTVNTGLRAASGSVAPGPAVSDRVFVCVLQYFVATYLLSKQKTWRIGMGMAPEYMSALPLKAALRQDRSKFKPGNIIAHKAERAGLATEVLDAVFSKLSRSTAASARDAVKAIKDLGAMEAARVRRGEDDGRASKAEVDSALKTTYMAILRKPGGITFSVVSHGASSTALKSGGARGGSSAHAGAGAGASSGGSGVPTGQVCVLKVVSIAPGCAKDTVIVYGPRISVGDYVLTVHSHRAAGAADRKVPTSILLKGDDQGANASYPLHLLLLPHEAAFTAGAGSVPAAPGRVRA